MATMHRFQLCLPPDLHEFLVRKAKRDGVSVAEVIRKLVIREANAEPTSGSAEYVLGLVGLCTGPEPLDDDIPVSEDPDKYLVETVLTGAD